MKELEAYMGSKQNSAVDKKWCKPDIFFQFPKGCAECNFVIFGWKFLFYYLGNFPQESYKFNVLRATLTALILPNISHVPK